MPQKCPKLGSKSAQVCLGIGERSGTGLSNLYALWGQHGFATPIIREEFDPEKTIVNIATESNQFDLDNTRTTLRRQTRTEPDGNSVPTRTEPVQNPCNQSKSASESAQGGPGPDQDPSNPLLW